MNKHAYLIIAHNQPWLLQTKRVFTTDYYSIFYR